MGGYEKQIVYFDLIENGEKVRNAGFSKIIAQNGQLRLTVQISGLHKTDTIRGELFFLQNNGEISVDNLQLQEGKCVYSRLLDSETLQKLQIQPEQLYGICVKAGENRMLRALWKPEPTEQEILNRETTNRETTNRETTNREEPLAEQWAEQPRVIKPQEAEAQTVQPQVIKPQEAEAQTVQSQVMKPQEAEAQTVQPQVIKPQEAAQTVQSQIMKPQEAEAQIMEPQIGVSLMKESYIREQQIREQQMREQQMREQQIREQHTRELHMEEATVFEDKWKQLEQTYPAIHPFRDDREYLSISPKDFIVLTREYQNLATNSFLLHGFYNYHHLILGKVSKKGDELFYIGVPGVFYEREKAVALMFGFESFECGKEPAQIGELGYYMKRVDI